MDFINSNTGWVVGFTSSHSSQILKTINSGLNWNISSVISSFHVFSVDFINSQTGWVCGDDDAFNPKIYKTTNGGLNWFNQPLSGNPFFTLNDIKFINDSTGFSAGENGMIYKTTNSGNNWIQYPNNSTNDYFYKIFFINQQTGWLAGGGETGYIYKTSDLGINWNRQTFFFNGFSSIWFIDSLRGWGCGSDGMLHAQYYKTTNGGSSWSSQYLSSMENGKSIYMIDSMRGWMISTDPNSRGYILRTNNGGSQWNINYSASNFYIYQFLFIDTLTAWAVGSTGKILKYGDLTSLSQNQNLANEFSLLQNYPNPFNPSTAIKFDIPKAGNVSLKIYDILGKEVYSINEFKSAGQYEFTFDATNYASGLYFYKLESGTFSETKKMVLVK